MLKLTRSSHNWNPYLSEKMNNLTQLITSMTDILAARWPTCAEIITNFRKYTLSIGQLKSHPELENMTRQLIADLPADTIYLDLMDQILLMEEKSVPAIDQGQIVSVPNQTVLAEPVINKNDTVVEAPVPIVHDEKPKVNKLARELNRIDRKSVV